MNAATQSEAPSPAPPPDLSIRARPPSPKRLSRKVLLGAAITLAAIVAAALLFGLSTGPSRFARQTDALANAGGPPESIQGAPADYASDDLGGGADEPGVETAFGDDALAPPTDPMWSGQAPASPPASTSTPTEAELQEAARTAPILFSSTSGVGESDQSDRLPSRLLPPRSRYEIMAGSVIAAALATELNSDAPGRVIAQVTAPVFDTITGAHLLIPQGSRLIGTYDNAVAYGDRRLVLVWNRLILPNGWSINLENMEGADPTGAGGLRDRTDNHFDRLAGAIALSAIISVVANNAEEDDEGASLSQSLGDAAAQEAARTGARIVERELSVRPTLRVRAGAPVRVLVMRDITLRPYRENRNDRR
ncbi:MAG: TrbI/VirB10 family protein [Hyphomonadaceae bacterium]|nr:TrbI/VirB10 family protein [Hyphomonadaceae bacterium]